MSLSEHLLETLKNHRDRLRCEPTESAKKAFGVDSTELIQSYEAGSTLKATRYPPWICPPPGRHRRHDYGAEILVQLVR